MKSKWVVVSVLWISIISSVGCDSGGATSPDVHVNEEGAIQIKEIVCEKLVACFPDLTDTECQNGVESASTIDDAFYDLTVDYASYSEVIAAEAAGLVATVDEYDALEDCQVEIAEEACDSDIIQAAYSSDDPSNFENVGILIQEIPGAGCGSILYDGDDVEACLAGGGEWYMFSSGCGDGCGLARSDSDDYGCTMALTAGCSCPSGQCWNGSACEDI